MQANGEKTGSTGNENEGGKDGVAKMKLKEERKEEWRECSWRRRGRRRDENEIEGGK